uniref:Uncharacterized protein n=1 Tax=Triticum urartu TaxID=4572 RepID=A0A8R7PE89_TRIUA
MEGRGGAVVGGFGGWGRAPDRQRERLGRGTARLVGWATSSAGQAEGTTWSRDGEARWLGDASARQSEGLGRGIKDSCNSSNRRIEHMHKTSKATKPGRKSWTTRWSILCRQPVATIEHNKHHGSLLVVGDSPAPLSGHLWLLPCSLVLLCLMDGAPMPRTHAPSPPSSRWEAAAPPLPRARDPLQQRQEEINYCEKMKKLRVDTDYL